MLSYLIVDSSGDPWLIRVVYAVDKPKYHQLTWYLGQYPEDTIVKEKKKREHFTSPQTSLICLVFENTRPPANTNRPQPKNNRRRSREHTVVGIWWKFPAPK